MSSERIKSSIKFPIKSFQPAVNGSKAKSSLLIMIKIQAFARYYLCC